MLTTISHILATLNILCLFGWVAAAHVAMRKGDKVYILFIFLAVITGLITSLLLTK